ncbi:hypothetical protein E2C01_013267 [Portunus trituberculatus]|uniref:Uncharacterized protein n=1 Tax=Portunus trituberculatus TaxID=210409 RepID=A0A5B7DGM3_PORTR|nr:hypothetical protein [Portunus trituberculatus]
MQQGLQCLLLIHCSALLFLSVSPFNLFSTVTCFHIYSAFYMVILYSFRNLCLD